MCKEGNNHPHDKALVDVFRSIQFSGCSAFIDKLVKLLEAYPNLLRHEVVADIDMIVLTDSSQAIRTFLSTFIDYEALWSSDAIEFDRKVAGTAPDTADSMQ